jgi:hypothetical protein
MDIFSSIIIYGSIMICLSIGAFVCILICYYKERLLDFDEETEKEYFTIEDLNEFNGDNDKLYISIKGNIFDVSNHQSFQKNKKYNNFCGHDVKIN